MRKIDVIVPVYKVEKYLDRCIESILSQSYSHFNLILVDDGSPDNSGIMCDEWAMKDHRIKVIHKPNGGLSSARNAGLDVASGEYICFVDSDDALHPKALEWMINTIEENNADVAVGKLERFQTVALPKMNFDSPPLEVITGKDAMDCYGNPQRERSRFVSSCGKLYKRRVFNNLRFPVGKLFEDEYTVYKAFHMASKVALLDANVYYYYVNPESITQNLTLEKFCDEYNAWFERILYIRDAGEQDLLNKAINSFLYDAQWHLIEARKNEHESEKIRIFIEQYEKVFLLGKEQGCVSFKNNYDYYVLSNPKMVFAYRIKRGIYKLLGAMK